MFGSLRPEARDPKRQIAALGNGLQPETRNTITQTQHPETLRHIAAPGDLSISPFTYLSLSLSHSPSFPLSLRSYSWSWFAQTRNPKPEPQYPTARNRATDFNNQQPHNRPHLTQCTDQMVLESELPHKIVNLWFTISCLYNKLTFFCVGVLSKII